MTSTLSIIAGQYSQKGLKEQNEDAYAIRVPKESVLTNKGIVIAIADGVSGSLAGREASEACVKGFVNDYYSTPESWTVKTSCQKVLGAINRWLYGQSLNLQHRAGQGLLTTLSTLVLKSSTGHIFHIGDSRIYRLRKGEFERLTRDHHRWANQERAFLSRAMGADINVEIDYRSVDLEVDDIFLLTTDGVHEFVRTRDLQSLIEDNIDNPEKATRDIVTKALKNGSDDNVTCQVCRIENLPHLDQESFYNRLTELPFPPPLEENMIIGGYKIVREIHASKRTQVYLATDTDTDKKVIIKTPSVNYDDDPVFIDGFLTEEWAGRRISNAHVLKVLEPKEQRKFLYYVTEFLDGITLRQWMNDNPKGNLDEVRNIINQIIKGVRAFQRQEMVHRDLKPENIMMDKQGTVKIVDFGSTKIAGIQEINKPIESNQLLGTLDYAAPEYFQGYAGSHVSDIFSIGVLCYEMLSGKLPYGHPLSLHNMKKVRYIPINQLNDEVPAWFDAAVEKCVRIDPQRRYETLSEFFSDITHPNKELINIQGTSIIEKNPIAFWQGLSILLLLLNFVLLFLLVKNG